MLIIFILKLNFIKIIWIFITKRYGTYDFFPQNQKWIYFLLQ